MKTGLKPYFKKSKKDFSFHRTFGSTNIFSDFFSLDKQIGDDFQGQTNECTAYTVTDNANNQDGVEYSPDYQMQKTYELDNASVFDGADIKTALSVPVVFGLLTKPLAPLSWQTVGEQTAVNPMNWPISLDVEAAKNKKQAYFMLEENTNWFDSIRSAIIMRNTPIALATPWYVEYNYVGKDGILPSGKAIESWHSTSLVGWDTFNGIPFLICKPHLGKNYGKNGYCYFSQSEIEKIMSISGSAAGVIINGFTNNIQTVQISLSERMYGVVYQFIWEILHPTRNAMAVKTNSELLYETAKGCLDTCMVAPNIDIEVGCASSVNDVHKKCFGYQIGGGASTANLLQTLISSPLFSEVTNPMSGDIIISATGSSTLATPPFVGHTGIIGNFGIMSNNSSNGLWQEVYTLQSWEQRYAVEGGYPTRYFRRK